jgi:hypothetical protein
VGHLQHLAEQLDRHGLALDPLRGEAGNGSAAAGGIFSCLRIRRMLEALTWCPSFSISPWIR